MLPGIQPTERQVEVAVVAIIKFQDGKVEHEHIYWDQASVLLQIGNLDPAGLAHCRSRSSPESIGQEFAQ